MSEDNYLVLKWGTIKSYNFEGNNEAIKLMDRYFKIGTSMAAALQKDTPEQKEIICKLIDLIPGDIFLAWEGVSVSKPEAKKYVMEYGAQNN